MNSLSQLAGPMTEIKICYFVGTVVCSANAN